MDELKSENVAAGGGGRFRPLIVICVAACMCTAVQMRFPYVNGPWYYAWNWELIPPQVFMPLMAAAGAPVFLGVWIYHRWRRRDWALFLVCLGFVLITLTVSWMQPKLGGWERTNRIVRSPGATSYFTAARQFFGPESSLTLRQFLSTFPERMPKFFLHAQTKPAGPVLYYAAWIHFFGPGNGTTLAAGAFFLVLTCGSILVTGWMVSVVTRSADAGVYAAICLALCPGTVVFYPGFDSVYPGIASAMIGTWVCAVRTGRARYAVAFGLALALAIFSTYVLLLLGAFLGVYSIAALWVVPGWKMRKLVGQSAVAIGVAVGVYFLIYLVSGYNALAAYEESRQLMKAALTWVLRPYPLTIGWDLHDFALGTGWVCPVLAVLYLTRGPRGVGAEGWVIGVLALLVPVVVALSHLVAGETARCWQMLIPLLLIPAGAELERWDRAGRLAAFLGLFAVLVVIAGRLSFISVEPLDKLPPGLW